MYEKLNDYDVTVESLNSLINKINTFKNSASNKSCFLGFDGYVDSLYSVVESRINSKDWTRMESMKTFGELMVNVAGSSANIERVLKKRIFGGFAPNTCRALNALGVKVSLVAALGSPEFNEFYNPLPEVESISITNPGNTLGLEFDDGKVMITDFEPILSITWKSIVEKIEREKFIQLIDSSDIMGFGHWALLPNLNEIWLHFLNDLFPSISNLENKIFFVDTADIRKRSKKDIKHLIRILKKINNQVHVMLSMNDLEAMYLSKALDNVKNIVINKNKFDGFINGGKWINNEAGLSYLAIHSPHFATISTSEDHYWVTEGFTSKPKFTVGAGDHFHSGTALGLSCNLTPSESILIGNSLAAIFVRTGSSPNNKQLSQFLNRYMEFIENDDPIFP